MKLSLFGEYVRVATRLGVPNVVRLATYKILKSLGYYRLRLPPATASRRIYWQFDKSLGRDPVRINDEWATYARRIVGGEIAAFSNYTIKTGFPPGWHTSVLEPRADPAPLVHWSQISEFSLPGGDIKGYWEVSRFDALLALALGWLESRETELAEALETWMSDWSIRNPVNMGVNWVSGQEVGLRVLHTMLAAELLNRLGGVETERGFHQFVAEHCARIEPTFIYARAQDNNHATSEAAALYVGGMWLSVRADAGNQFVRWRDRGRRWLEECLARLVTADGSFSQHSVNYHRLLLDTLSAVEVFRRWFEDVSFSEAWYSRARAATRWLHQMVDPQSGDAPNLGGNDGARAFVLHRLPYRDYRPTVQLASVVFLGRKAYDDGPWDEPLAWLQLPRGDEHMASRRKPVLFDQGGYATLTKGETWIVLRLPIYRFRPSHADALHVDAWRQGKAVFSDAGSYSYAAQPRWLQYFPGTESHNTVQFDQRDQMPRLGRFLFGRWLLCRELEFDPDGGLVRAAYTDHLGAFHRRTVHLIENGEGVVVRDEVSGFEHSAVLRWRLSSPIIAFDRYRASASGLEMEVSSSVGFRRSEIVTGWTSLYYAEKRTISVWEIEVDRPSTIETRISFQP